MLHGRADEVASLVSLLDEAAGGRSMAVAVVGDAGAGKTALLDEVCRLIADGRTLLRARGIESESDLPYAGIHQLLRPIVGGYVDAIPSPQAAAMKGALGIDPSGTNDIHNVSLAVLSLLAEAAATNPVVAVVDDAHWLDHESLRAIVFAARRLHAEGVAILFGTRPNDFLTGSLASIELGPLDVDATAAIISEALQTTVDPDVSRTIADATDGNALAITEIARVLTPGQVSGREPLPENMPTSSNVSRFFDQRIEALPAEAHLALLVAAADNAGVTSVVLRAAEQLEVSLADFAAAERQGLIRVDNTNLEFRHPLVRSAVYGKATFIERQKVHRALASVLDELGERDRSAWHRGSAAIAPDEEAAAGLVAAATRAHDKSAYATASAAYEKAAGLSPSGPVQGERLVRAATESWLAGDLETVEQLIGEAEPLVVETGLAECYRLRGSIELATGATPNTVEVLVRAARRTASVQPGRAIELLALAGEGAAVAADPAANEEIRDIAGTVETSDSDRDRFFARLVIGFTHLEDQPELAIDALNDAIAFARDEREDVDLLLAAGRAAIYVGDDDDAIDFHGRILDRARRIASVGCLAIAGSRMALVEIMNGRWNTGLATAEEASRMAEDTGQLELAAHALTWQSLLAAWRGNEEEVDRLTGRAKEIAARYSMAFVDDGIRWARGALFLSSGSAYRAIGQLREVAHPLIMNAASLDGLEAAVAENDVGETDRWIGWMRDALKLSDVPWARARLSHGEALVADSPEKARDNFELALVEHRLGGRRFETARTELAYGSFLRRHRRRVEARDHLRAALAIFEDLETPPWEERATTELRATGETAKKRDPSTNVQLTPQELRVIDFVGQGLTNREVAARLFLSPRTIDYHLRSIFTKLGITSRTELARMHLEGLVALTGGPSEIPVELTNR